MMSLEKAFENYQRLEAENAQLAKETEALRARYERLEAKLSALVEAAKEVWDTVPATYDKEECSRHAAKLLALRDVAAAVAKEE